MVEHYVRKPNRIDISVRESMPHVRWRDGVRVTREAAVLAFFRERYPSGLFNRQQALAEFAAAYPRVGLPGNTLRPLIQSGLLRLEECQGAYMNQILSIRPLAQSYLSRFCDLRTEEVLA